MKKRIGVKVKKKLRIEYLYLDLQSCERCMSADKVLDSVVETLGPVMDMAGYAIDYQKVLVENKEIAEKYCFLSSPTILLDGEDVFGTVIENDCACCSDIAGTDIKCRAFPHEGRLLDCPTKEMMINAILSSLYCKENKNKEEYILPDNLKNFFEGKLNHK